MSLQYDNLILDGNNLLFRSFVKKRAAIFHEDLNIAPVHQFLKMVITLTAIHKPNRVYITWDKKLIPDANNFRKNYTAYKENRTETETSRAIVKLLPIIEEFTSALGIKTIYPNTTEADDVICFLAKQLQGTTLIISADHDLLQLVTNDVNVYLPFKNTIVTPENFEYVMGVKLENFVLYKCILGDSSDNIKGLYNYGKVRAKTLSEQIGNFDNSREYDFLTQDQKEIINNNLIICDLNRAENMIPQDYEIFHEQLANNHCQFNSEILRELFKKYNFHSFNRKIGYINKLFNNNFEEDDLLSQIVM